MIQYILECIAFQLVFLIIYDFFLKRETFFQWNRAYLIGTYLLSMVLPLIRIEAFKTTVPEQYAVYPQFLLNLEAVSPTVNESARFTIATENAILFGGMILASVYFIYKLIQIYRLRQKGTVRFFPNFTRVVVANSELAFSFFKSIFLGDKVLEKEHKSIIQHELVHIEQKHTWDLLFFELMRIVGWFNPLVYVYQSRVSELHEFIADAQVAKTHKKEQYESLLGQVFQTRHISFINQFFKSSLIKKRIVMLQKTKSKSIWQLKYLVLVPLVLGMLVYTSCEQEIKELDVNGVTANDQELVDKISKDLQNEDDIEIEQQLKALMDRMIVDKEILSKEEYFRFKVLSYKAFSKPKVQINDGDTLYYLGGNTEFKNPTDKEYEYYVNRAEAFQIIDPKLRVSISYNELDIRKIEKEDKNLGPGEFLSVENVSNLTDVERYNISKMMTTIDFSSSFIYISDDENAFLITKMRSENINKKDKSDSTFARYNELVAERNKLLRSVDEKNPIIVNLDNQIEALKESLELNELDEFPFAYLDEAPIFPGCENENDKRDCFKSKMQEHIVEHFRYPETAQVAGIQGKVYVNFVIDENGQITELRMRGPDGSLEEEARRIVELLPKLIPGKHEGKNVRVPFSMPITFKLQ